MDKVVVAVNRVGPSPSNSRLVSTVHSNLSNSGVVFKFQQLSRGQVQVRNATMRSIKRLSSPPELSCQGRFADSEDSSESRGGDTSDYKTVDKY
ncbi:hypothetical protein H2248_008814 [Termitomyces sp. 'cryptogamus']|nr:hypothetical protein H2248_008814 [Termitomyces sp. 'cryptogamus']